MRILWGVGSCAARDVHEVAQREQGWAPSTTKTILRRLVEKGFVKTRRVGNSFLYRPAQSALASLIDAADRLLENAIEGTTGPLLAHMVRKGDLSPDELAELRALLDEHAEAERGGS